MWEAVADMDSDCRQKEKPAQSWLIELTIFKMASTLPLCFDCVSMTKPESHISAAAVAAGTIQNLLLLHTERQKRGVSADKKAKLDELVAGLGIVNERLSIHPETAFADLTPLCKSHMADAIASKAEIYQDHYRGLGGADPDYRNGLVLAARLFEYANDINENQTWMHWRGLLLNELGDHQAAADSFGKASEISGGKDIYQVFQMQSLSAAQPSTSKSESGQDADALLNSIRASVKAITGMDISDEELQTMARANDLLQERFEEAVDDEVVEAGPFLPLDQQLKIAQFGVETAYLIVDGHYEEARKRFGASFKSDLSLQDMKAEYEEMTSYSETPMETAYAMAPYVVDGCAHIYIAVQSDDISEAITFIFNHVEEKKLEIEGIDWGRP